MIIRPGNVASGVEAEQLDLGYSLWVFFQLFITPFAVHLRKIYIHLRQQLKPYGKYTFISTYMNFINANELSITLLFYICINIQ